ncbi:tRNA synthetases class I (M)-domain-containing protein [Aspergillus unguis]
MASLRRDFRVLSGANQLLWSNRSSWKCASCKVTPTTVRPPRRFATTAGRASNDSKGASTKPYYVTTPIFYVNSAPHVGHLYTMVVADILKRWRKQLLGEEQAKLLTGTDEHGMKIQQAALAAGIDTQTFCDNNCKTFKDLAQAANMDYDRFIRTTDPEHKEAVQYFWDMLQHRGYIYTAKHEGWYSVSDETFYPESQIHLALDPATGRKRMVSIETGKEVEWTSETNYHFRLSAMKNRLLNLYKTGFITPEHYAPAIIQSVNSGLSDLSISRPAQRLTWGVPVPNDDTQTIYVWLDALVNYLTAAGYPFTPGKESGHGWPADVHLVGKDIVRFHCVYWPAFLMALDLPLPRNVLVHGHWKINQEKMSKSTGNTVNPFFAIDRFGADTMRFFLAHHAKLDGDANYDNQLIINAYKKYLQQGIGNTMYRILGIAGRNLRWYVEHSAEFGPSALDQAYEKDLAQLPISVAEHMNNLKPHKAISKLMKFALQTNKYFQSTEPWTDSTGKARSIFNVLEALRITAILLQPYMPTKAEEMLDLFHVQPTRRKLEHAQYGSDLDYGSGIRKKMLFPPLITED